MTPRYGASLCIAQAAAPTSACRAGRLVRGEPVQQRGGLFVHQDHRAVFRFDELLAAVCPEMRSGRS